MWNINIKIDGKKIEPSSHVKYLWILIDSFLNWNFHIDELSTKLSCAVGMLAKIRHYINEKTLSMVYHGIFSSLLIYGSQIWGQSNQSVSKMEKLQNKALRIINFKPLRYSVNSLYIINVKYWNLVIVLSYQIFYMHMIILRVICQQPCVLVLHFWTVNTHRLLEIKKVTR